MRKGVKITPVVHSRYAMKLLVNGIIERTTINHNVLAKNIVCGGDFQWIKDKLYISNQSGHYLPDHSCLKYTCDLFEQYGFHAEISKWGGRTRRKHRKRTRRR